MAAWMLWLTWPEERHDQGFAGEKNAALSAFESGTVNLNVSPELFQQ